MVCYQGEKDSQAREWKKLKVSHCQILKPLLVQVGKRFAKLALFMLSIEFFYEWVNWRCVLNVKNIQNGYNGDCFQLSCTFFGFALQLIDNYNISEIFLVFWVSQQRYIPDITRW